jgi:hypothetical protein
MPLIQYICAVFTAPGGQSAVHLTDTDTADTLSFVISGDISVMRAAMRKMDMQEPAVYYTVIEKKPREFRAMIKDSKEYPYISGQEDIIIFVQCGGDATAIASVKAANEAVRQGGKSLKASIEGGRSLNNL